MKSSHHREADTRSKSDTAGNFSPRFEVSLSRVIGPGFLLAIVSTIVVAVSGYYGDRRLATDMRGVVQTHFVIETIASVRVKLKEIQERQLRFVLTGDEGYLRDFTQDSAALKSRMSGLRLLTKDDPSQQRRLDALDGLVEARLALTGEIKDARRREDLAAANLLVNSTGAALSYPALDLLTAMTTREEALLVQRSARAYSTAWFNTEADFWGGAFTIIWLCFAGVLTWRALHRLDRSRRSLSELNQNLEHRVAERSAALQSQSNMLQSVLESMTESVVVVDVDQQLKQFNPAAVRVLGAGTDFQHLGNESWRKTFRTYRSTELEPLKEEELPLTMALAGHECDAVELRIVDRASGRQVWVEASTRPIRGADGKIEFAVLAFHDVTIRKQNDHEVRRARDLAVESARRRSEFLSTMSHEIRTPLNGIIGTTQLLQSSDLTSEQRDFADTVLSSANILLKTVNDILDFSQLTEGRVELQQTEFDLMKVLKATREKFLDAANKKRIEILLKFDPHSSNHLIGDPIKLSQVLDHLVGNAVKFTHHGLVIIRARKISEDYRTVSMRIDIRDTGIGIAPEVTRRLFQPFSQAAGFISRKHDGTGLGLVIAEELVELMGGNIALSSQPGVGSVFHFTIDFEKAGPSIVEIASGRESEAEARRNKRILVVDATLVDRMVAATQLKKLGYAPDTVGSGDEAIHAIAKKAYDVVLIDCEMSMSDTLGPDGYRVIRAIRDREVDARRTIVIAMTARSLEGVRATSVEAAIDDYLSKPTALEAVEAMLRRWTSPAGFNPALPRKEIGPFTAARTRSGHRGGATLASVPTPNKDIVGI